MSSYEIKDIRAVITDETGVHVKPVSVYIDGGLIAGVNRRPDGFIPDYVYSNNARKLLIPGLINAHTHSHMSLLRGCADDMPFHTWLFDRVLPLEDRLTPQSAAWGTLLSCAEMIRTGTTCFNDMHMFEEVILDAVHRSGMRAVLSRGLVGTCRDGIPSDGGRLEQAFRDIDAYRQQNTNGLISFALAPHAPYTCDEGYLRHVAQTARTHGLRLHIHVAESRRECEDSQREHSKTPVEWLDSIGILDSQTLAAHCVHVTPNDIGILRDRGVSVAVNTVSNMKLGNGFAPVPQMAAAGVNIALGTDGAASNNTQNLFRELNALTLVHKGHTQDPASVPAREAFYMATMGGARALGLDGVTGAIQEGLRADLVILNLDMPHLTPCPDEISALAYGMTGLEAETVFINGKPVMEKGELLTIDLPRVLYETEQAARKLHG